MKVCEINKTDVKLCNVKIYPTCVMKEIRLKEREKFS